MSNDLYTTVAQCQSCAVQGTIAGHQKHLNLSPAAEPLEFIAVNILDPFPKTKSVNQHVTVLTDQYTKLKMAIPVATETSTSATTIFFDNWVISHIIPTYQLTDNRPHFVSKFFAAVIARFANETPDKNRLTLQDQRASGMVQ